MFHDERLDITWKADIMNYTRTSIIRTVTYTLARGLVVNIIRDAIGALENLDEFGESFSYDVPILPGSNTTPVEFVVTYEED